MFLRPACVVGLFALAFASLSPAAAQEVAVRPAAPKAEVYVAPVQQKPVLVPDFIGKTLQQVNTANVVPGTTQRLFASIDPQGPANGLVETQNPVAGTPILPGKSRLLLVLQTPTPRNVQVPNVEGMNQANATRLLAGLNLLAVPRGDTSGVVTLQSPAAGRSVAPGTQVSLVFAAPQKTVAVPDFRGATLQQVNDANVVPGTTQRLFASIAPQLPANGVVEAQKPAAGTQVLPGSSPLFLVLSTSVSSGQQPNTLQVPNVEGLNQANATALLTRVKLRPVVQGNTSGVVTLQSPAAGQIVAPGTGVSLVFAVPQTIVLVPDFRGQTLQQVNAANIVAGSNQPLFASIDPQGPSDGIVEAQKPAAGSRVVAGASQLLLVLEAQTPQTVKVPDVEGQNQASATALLAGANLSSVIRGDSSGVVALQSPAAGQSVAPGSEVTITFALPQVTVPLLVGKTLSEATQSLNAASLQVGAVDGQNADNSIVSDQSPPAGTEVEPGTAVGLTVTGPYVAPAQVYVPSLIKMTSDQAMQALNSVGLRIGPISGAPNGRVSTQNPAPGVQVSAGSGVSFSLVAGPPSPTPSNWKWPIIALTAAGIGLVGVGAGVAIAKLFTHPPAPTTVWSVVTTRVSSDVQPRTQPTLRFKLTVRDRAPAVDIRTHGEPSLRRLTPTGSATDQLALTGKFPAGKDQR